MDLHPWGLWTTRRQAGGRDARDCHDARGRDGEVSRPSRRESLLYSRGRSVARPGARSRCRSTAPKAGASGRAYRAHAVAHLFSHGDYDASAAANEAAIKADKVYLRERNPKGIYPMIYVPHNIQFLWASYMMEGNSRGAFKASRELDRPCLLRWSGRCRWRSSCHRRDILPRRASPIGTRFSKSPAAGRSDVHDRSLALCARPRVGGEESSGRRAR